MDKEHFQIPIPPELPMPPPLRMIYEGFFGSYFVCPKCKKRIPISRKTCKECYGDEFESGNKQ